MREVLTSVPGAVVSVHRDREGHPRVIFANDAFETFYGIPPSALTSDARILRDLVHPDDAARVMRAINKSAEELTVLRVRFRLRNPRRGDAWVDFDARPVRHDDGSTVFHAIVRDVSDDVRTEEDARIAQEQLRHALAASDMGAFRSDLRAGEVALDAKASALLALPPDTSVGTVTFDEVMANVEPEDVDRVRTAVDEVRRGERAAVTIEYRVRLDGGDVRWVQSRSVVSLDNDGAPAALTGVLLDVTRERHETELRLRSQKLEAIGTLASGIAHDFNNLLSVMTNAAWFIGDALDKAGDESPWIAASKGDVEHIQRAAESGARLTRQLLAFARRETIDPRPLDLNQTVKELEPFLQRTIGEHVALHVNLAPDLRAVFGDAGQIEQILVNLAVNARDAMPGGGLLEIDTQNVDLDDEAHPNAADHVPGHYVRLRVSDSGTGIPSELLDRVFEPFFTTKPSGEGTGLGLATVYGIVTQMGGRARIYSELGHGTTFTALFPATGAIAEVRAASHTIAPARRDDPARRRRTRAALAHRPHPDRSRVPRGCRRGRRRRDRDRAPRRRADRPVADRRRDAAQARHGSRRRGGLAPAAHEGALHVGVRATDLGRAGEHRRERRTARQALLRIGTPGQGPRRDRCRIGSW